MKKKVIKAEPQGNGTLLTFEDGSQEFLEGVTATLSKSANQNESISSDDEESLLASMKRN